MRAEDSIGAGYSNSLQSSGGSDVLSRLASRVEDGLKLSGPLPGSTAGQQTADQEPQLDQQKLRNMIAGMNNQPVAGMNLFTVA